MRRGGSVSDEVRSRVMERDGFICAYCGVSVQTGDKRTRQKGSLLATIDHVIPLCLTVRTRCVRGWHNPWNLVTACEPCNTAKGESVSEENLAWWNVLRLICPGGFRTEAQMSLSGTYDILFREHSEELEIFSERIVKRVSVYRSSVASRTSQCWRCKTATTEYGTAREKKQAGLFICEPCKKAIKEGLNDSCND